MLGKDPFLASFILIVCFLIVIIWFYFVTRSIRFQKRIENHVISSGSLEDISILDQIRNRYQKWRQNKIEKMEACELWKKYYLSRKGYLDTSFYFGLLLDKSICSISFLFLYLFLSIFNTGLFSILLLFCVCVLGFYFPNILISFQKKIKKKQIDKDLLKAISLMNNAFQSGKSIIQAIQIVSLELEGPISQEFSKIHQDMLHGLSFERAFLRFQERVQLEEIGYITASLSILNRTGGNIMKVFSSIENNFYTRRKLEMELKATIASSRLVFQFLILLPIFLCLFIGIMNPTYFIIFKKSTLGFLLFIIILSIYLIYVIVVYHIMKIEKY